MKVPCCPESLHADLMTLSSHKIHGPKGVGALYVGEDVLKRKDLVPVIYGGGQEQGFRSGTENVPGIAGFAASAYMRGIGFAQIPTTLLAAVDSSVGGKTAVDLVNGKNMVGAFHQPVAVFCDVDRFATLPKEVYSDGMAEAIKYGMIYDANLFDQIEAGTISDEDLVKRSVEIKAEVVALDEFDKGPRHILNFGHTLGHAIETLSKYSIGHGSGVAMGMAVLSAAILSEEESNRLNKVLAKYDLPTVPSFDIHEMAALAKTDKKSHGNLIRSVLPVRIGEVRLQDVTVEEWEEIVRKGIDKLK
jgi:3-dehydroquinate synthase